MDEALETLSEVEVEPPAYGDPGSEAPAPVLGPATLHTDGRFIHSSDNSAPPLYELSHSIAFLRDTDRTVRFERLDQTVKNYDDGRPPLLATRNRHLYNLKHAQTDYAAILFHAEALTRRRTLCPYLGLTWFHPSKLSRRRGYNFHRLVIGKDHRWASQGMLFSAVPSKDKTVSYEWSNTAGELVAREVKLDGSESLVIGADMSVAERDALVVSWVMRIWAELSRQTPPRETRWENFKRIVGSKNSEVGGMNMGLFR